MHKKIEICLIIITLLLSSFIFIENNTVTVDAVSTPGTGVNWTIKQFAVNGTNQIVGSGFVWTIKEDMIVKSADTLVIPPGTTIKVVKGVIIDIQGRLIAAGTVSNPIIITSAESIPKAGDWSTLRFNTGKANSILERVSLGYAVDGIYVYKTNVMIKHCTISSIVYRGIYLEDDRSTLYNNTISNIYNPDTQSVKEGTGVRTFNSNARIGYNHINYIQKAGIRLESSKALAIGNNITQTKIGVHVRQSIRPSVMENLIWNTSQGIVMELNDDVDIGGNRVENNSQLGIYVHFTSTDIHDNIIQYNGKGIVNYFRYENVSIRNNKIMMNKISGITFDDYKNLTISGNYIWHNSYEPIFCKNVDNLRIENNIIKRNEDEGISLTDCTDVFILNNFIDDNRGGQGIYLNNVDSPSIWYNTIKDAGFHGLKFENTDVFDFQNNEILKSHQKDVWLDKSIVYSINLTFDFEKVQISSNSKLILMNYLTVKVQDKFLTAIMGANVTVKDGVKTVYSKKTNGYGRVDDMLLVDLTFNGKNTPTDNVTTVSVDYSDFVFDNNPRIVDMSRSHTEVFGRNRIPTIHITRPSNKDVVSGQIFINGTAFDPDGLIQSVDISINDGAWKKTKSLTLYWSTWSLIWNTTDVTDGEYTVTARVYDGINYTYDKITLNVNNGGGTIKPYIYVLIISPAIDEIISGEIDIIGRSFSNLGDIISVEIMIDEDSYEFAQPGNKTEMVFNKVTGLYEEVIVPDWTVWGYNWDSTKYSDGMHTITAKVLDDKNNVDTEAVNIIIDNNGSTTGLKLLEITHPKSTDVLNGEIEISGKLHGFSNSLTFLEMRIDDGDWFGPIVFQWFDWWLFNHIWDTSEYEDGLHEISVRGGNLEKELDTSIIVIVSNGGAQTSFGIKISKPEYSEVISDLYEVQGYAWSYGKTINRIQYRIDNNKWQDVVGYDINIGPVNGSPAEETGFIYTQWSFVLNTHDYKDDAHMIFVRAENVEETVIASTTVFFINDGSGSNGSSETLEDELYIGISRPNYADIVMGDVLISGIALAKSGNITSVEIQIDNLGYITTQLISKSSGVLGNTVNWEYLWDTTIHADGFHSIYARVNALIETQPITSKPVQINVMVLNEEGSKINNSIPDIDILILYPNLNETVNGTVLVAGIGYASVGQIEGIQVRLDTHPWIDATPTHPKFYSWTYQLNTSKYRNGAHNLTARIISGKMLANRTIQIFINNSGPGPEEPTDPNGTEDPSGQDQNGKTDGKTEGLDRALINALLAAITIILILIVIIFAFIYRMKYRKATAVDESEGESNKQLDSDRGTPEKKSVDKLDVRSEPEADFIEDEDDEIIVIRGEFIETASDKEQGFKVQPKEVYIAEKPTHKLSNTELATLPLTKPLDISKKKPEDVKKTKIPVTDIPDKKDENLIKTTETGRDNKDKEVQRPAIKSETVTKPAEGKTILLPNLEKKLNLLDKKLSEGKISKAHYERLKAQYIEKSETSPVDEKDPAGKSSSLKPPMNCTKCGKPPKFIDAYKAWYCADCKTYVARIG